MISTFANNASKSSIASSLLTGEEERKIDAYWRAANYLSVGQIYLYANPLRIASSIQTFHKMKMV